MREQYEKDLGDLAREKDILKGRVRVLQETLSTTEKENEEFNREIAFFKNQMDSMKRQFLKIEQDYKTHF